MKRRSLLTLAAAGALSTAIPAWAAKKPKPRKILILGGTRFIGLHMTALALERGHTLTFFNRGKTKTDRYPEVERIKGDRNGEIDGLEGPRVGCRHRQLRLRAAPRAALGGAAGAESEAIRVHFVDLRVSGLQGAARRDPRRSARWPTRRSRRSTATPTAR